jgi:hypothetical protein
MLGKHGNDYYCHELVEQLADFRGDGLLVDYEGCYEKNNLDDV